MTTATEISKRGAIRKDLGWHNVLIPIERCTGLEVAIRAQSRETPLRDTFTVPERDYDARHTLYEYFG